MVNWTAVLKILKLREMREINKEWQKPEVTDLGSAKDIIQNVNVTGGGDTQFSVLLPS